MMRDVAKKFLKRKNILKFSLVLGFFDCVKVYFSSTVKSCRKERECVFFHKRKKVFQIFLKAAECGKVFKHIINQNIVKLKSLLF